MNTRDELHALVNQFTDKELKCCITLKTEVDHVPLDGGSQYILEIDDTIIKAVSLSKAQQERLLELGAILISLNRKKEKVIKFTSKEQVRTDVFQAYKDFLVTIRNHGKGFYYQVYEITITIPK